MKGYIFLLSTPLIAMGVVDTSGSFNKAEVSRKRGDGPVSIQPQPAHLQILKTLETSSAVPAVTPAKTSPRAFSKADPGSRYAAVGIASPVSSTTDLSEVGATIAIASTSGSPGSGVIALPALINDEHASSPAFATKIIAAGASTKFTQPAAISMATGPQAEQIPISRLAPDKAVGSLLATMTRVTKGTTTKVRPANLARTGLKATNLGIGNGQSVLDKTSPVDLISATYGTSARNAHKVYFPKQFESSVGALQVDSGMEAGSAKIGQRALTGKGGFDHYEETSSGESAKTSQLKGNDVAPKGDRSDQPESSHDENAETMSERGDAALAVASLNQPLETGSVY